MAAATGSPAKAPDPDPSGRATVRLPPVPASARVARELILSVTGREEDPAAALVVTELVTNAVLHGRSELDLTVEFDGAAVTLVVHDEGPGCPVAYPFERDGEPATSGRGLAMVQQISDDWGITPDASGKAVWARVTLD